MKVNKFKEFDSKINEDKLDARKIVINCLTMYNLSDVEKNKHQSDLANEIINDLVNAGLMK